MRVTAKLEQRDLGGNLAEVLKRAREIREMRVKVGVLSSGKGAVEHPGSDLTVAEIAAILEFGTEDGHIPARPALRSTFDAQREELVKLGAKLIDKVLDGKMDTRTALNVLGAKLAAETKKTITTGDGVPPPNAPSTIAAKGSSRPWVDTGRTVGAITWQVQDGDDGKHEEK